MPYYNINSNPNPRPNLREVIIFIHSLVPLNRYEMPKYIKTSQYLGYPRSITFHKNSKMYYQ